MCLIVSESLCHKNKSPDARRPAMKCPERHYKVVMRSKPFPCLVMHAKKYKPFDVWHSTATLGSMGDILATFRLVFPEGTYRMLRRCSSKRKRLSCAWNERRHEIIAWVSHWFDRTHHICSLAPLIVISFKHWWQLAAKTTDLSVTVPRPTRVT